MHIPIYLLLLLLFCSRSCSERSGNYYSRYGGRGKENAQSSSPISFSSNSEGVLALFNKVNQYIGYCTLAVYAYRFGRRIFRLDSRHADIEEDSGKATTFVKLEDEAIHRMKTDNEEIWNAILNIHNTQSEIKDEIQRLDRQVGESGEGDGQSLSALRTIFEENIDNMNNEITNLRLKIENLENNSIELAKDIASVASAEAISDSTFAEMDARRLIDENNKILLKKLSVLKDELLQTILKIKRKP